MSENNAIDPIDPPTSPPRSVDETSLSNLNATSDNVIADVDVGVTIDLSPLNPEGDEPDVKSVCRGRKRKILHDIDSVKELPTYRKWEKLPKDGVLWLGTSKYRRWEEVDDVRLRENLARKNNNVLNNKIKMEDQLLENAEKIKQLSDQLREKDVNINNLSDQDQLREKDVNINNLSDQDQLREKDVNINNLSDQLREKDEKIGKGTVGDGEDITTSSQLARAADNIVTQQDTRSTGDEEETVTKKNKEIEELKDLVHKYAYLKEQLLTQNKQIFHDNQQLQARKNELTAQVKEQEGSLKANEDELKAKRGELNKLWLPCNGGYEFSSTGTVIDGDKQVSVVLCLLLHFNKSRGLIIMCHILQYPSSMIRCSESRFCRRPATTRMRKSRDSSNRLRR
jgi:hypothetical protein